MLKRLTLFFFMVFACVSFAFAGRDWEYWNQEQLTILATKRISFIFNSEWRFNKDMHDNYLFKQENGVSFKITDWFDFIPYYVYQRKKGTGANNWWDGSDIMYLDEVFKLTLDKLFNIKVNDRFRYQYDFDKAKTILRNSLRLSRDFPLTKKFTISPFISEEPFYDGKLDRITEHRSSSGLSLAFGKNISLDIGYMLNSKKAKKWTYANVLVSNLKIKF